MEEDDPDHALVEAVRRVLIHVAAAGRTVAYRDLAAAAGVPGPHAIHKTTRALEMLAARDAAAGRALLSAVAVGKHGRPRPGFFQCVRDLGRYDGPDEGPEADGFHDTELAAVHAAWRLANGQRP